MIPRSNTKKSKTTKDTTPEDLADHRLGKLFKPLGPDFDDETLLALVEGVGYFDSKRGRYKWDKNSIRYDRWCITTHVDKKEACRWTDKEDPEREFACSHCVK